jgi:hypothetical protein
MDQPSVARRLDEDAAHHVSGKRLAPQLVVQILIALFHVREFGCLAYHLLLPELHQPFEGRVDVFDDAVPVSDENVIRGLVPAMTLFDEPRMRIE